MIETVPTPYENENPVEQAFGYDTFDSMIWLDEMRQVRSKSHLLRTDLTNEPPAEHEKLVISLQPSLQADYPLAWVARTVAGENPKQTFGEVWSLTKSGWFCQKNELANERAVEQFWGYYSDNAQLQDPPIGEVLSPSELEVLDSQGFVSQGIEVDPPEKDAFVLFLADVLNDAQERAGIGPKRVRIFEDLTLEKEGLKAQIDEYAAEVLEPFGANWVILSTEPLLVLRRYADEDVAVGIPAATAHIEAGGKERTMPMHYYRLRGGELLRHTDESRSLSEVFDKGAFDARIAAWRAGDDEMGKNVDDHEANYLAEYLRTCSAVSSLFTDIDELAVSQLSPPQRIRIPDTASSAVLLRTIRHKQIDPQCPQTLQTMETVVGDATWVKWAHLGLYSQLDQKIRDVMLQYDRKSGVVGVICGSIADMSAENAYDLFEKNAKRFLRASSRTLEDIYARPLGDDSEVYSPTTNESRDQWWFHAANAYPALLGMIEEWRSVHEQFIPRKKRR